MWLFTTVGFFSVVQKAGQPHLTVRARVADDLDQLRAKYMPTLSGTIQHAGTDYPYRATISHEDFAVGLAGIARDIHYSNFKNEVYDKQGYKREELYSKVWGVLKKLESQPEDAVPASTPVKPHLRKVPAYGAVVFNSEGQVLLREVRNHFDGYVWTFPKGRLQHGETPEAAATREALEETGVEARIDEQMPGVYEGGTTTNTYFLMSYIRETGTWDDETQAIRWVSENEARQMIAMTTNPTGRERDLKVLEAAFRLHVKQS